VDIISALVFEVEEASQRGRPRRTWKEVTDRDMNELYLKQVMIKVKSAVLHKRV